MPRWRPTLALFLFAFSSLLPAVRASSCLAFDINFNLLVFGVGGKDWNAGTQDTWNDSGAKATDITTSGRPPFDGALTTCYLSFFTNAVYVLGADKSNPSAVHIYNAASKSWSTQAVNAGAFDPTSYSAILDHDTNVFYALSHGELFDLDMVLLKEATGSTISWNDVKPGFPADYQPVMALAENHIHFFNTPDAAPGTAKIFVIHFSFFQPDAQSYPASSGNTFPSTHGQATSFFKTEGVQEEIAFIPDDGSATYIINVVNNSTRTLPGPLSKDPNSIYFGGATSLVQMDSKGAVSYLPYKEGDSSVSTQWLPVQPVRAVAPPSTGNSSGVGPTGTSPNGGASGNGTNTPAKGNGGASDKNVARITVALTLMALTALLS